MKTTCEEWGCRYWDKEKGICTDPIDWKNKQGESVCGLRDDALYPTPYFEQSCATGPFIYRTDTGDETGKVVESADLPWVTVDGKGVFRINGVNNVTTEIPGIGLNVARVPEKSEHRIANDGFRPLVIIEVQTYDADDPSGESDIHRIEDDYGRVVSK